MPDPINLLRLRAKAKRKLEQETAVQAVPADVSQVAPEQQETSLSEMLFPTLYQKHGGQSPTSFDGSTMGVLGSMVGDLFQAPTRALGAITGQGEMNDPESNVWNSARTEFRDFLDRGMQSNEQHAQQMQQKYSQGHWTDQLDENDPDKYLLDPRRSGNGQLRALRTAGDLMFDIGGDPSVIASGLKNVLKLGKPFAKKAVEAPGKLAGSIAEEVGTVPEEALRMWGTKDGKKALQGAWNQELPAAKEMADKVFNVAKNLPERKQVNAVLQEMKPIEMDSFIGAIKAQKKAEEASPVVSAFNKKIDKWAKDAEKRYGGKKLSAKKYRDMRMDLDQSISFTADEKALMDDAFLGVRRKMADNLTKSAPKEWQPLMGEYAEKLQTVDKMKGKLGNDKEKAVERAFSLLRTSENASRQPTKEMMKEFDSVFGTEFSKKSEIMDLSRKLGKTGKKELELPLLPKGATGNRWVALLTGPLGFPRTAPTTLKTIDKLESAAKTGAKITSQIARDDVAGAQALISTIESLGKEQKTNLDKALEENDETTINSILGE